MSQGREWWERFWSERTPDATGLAAEADTWHDLVWKVALEHWHGVFEELAPGRRMLECGCGSAKVSRYMAARRYDCTLLDYSPQGIRLAVAGFTENCLQGRFVIGDLHHLPFSDACFDVAYCGGVLEFFRDIQPPIREMVRVLRPGGLFAANVVPQKFSIQTVADLERTIAHSVRNLSRAHISGAFRAVRAVPADYHLNRARLRDYAECCRTAGLMRIAASVTSPFPALALPALGEKLYVRAMKALVPHWQRFDRSAARWTEVWGTTYTIHGTKG